MSVPPSVWRTLGIPATNSSALIRQAYAAKLKQTHPEDDPDGFKALRAAYETAMRLAAMQPHPVAVGESHSEPAPVAAAERLVVEQQPPAPAAPQPDPALLRLQQAFHELHRTLSTQDEGNDQAAKSLAVILGSPALDNISLEQQMQYRLAELLASSVPRSDALLSAAVQRFGWANPSAQLRLTPAMAHVLSRLGDLAALEQLRSADSPYAKAFAGLCRRRLRFIRWITAHVTRAGQRTESELLQVLRVEHPTLVPLLNSDAVAFWDTFWTRPRVSFPLIAFGLALTAVLGTIGRGALQSWTLGLATGGISLGLVLWKLYLLDWPRHHLRQKWPVSSPLWIRTGWLLLGAIGVLIVAALPPVGALTWSAVALSVVVLHWTLLVRQPAAPAPKGAPQFVKNRLVILLAPLGVMLVWWLAVRESFPPDTALPLSVPSFTLLLATSLGLAALQDVWLFDVSSSQRRTALLLLTAITIGTGAAVWLLATRTEYRPLCTALLLAIIALHRPAAAFLSWRQQEVRFGVVIGGFFALFFVAERPEILQRTAALGALGLVIVTSILLCLLMGLWNERRSKVDARAE